MSEEMYERVLAHPKFAEMTSNRARFSWRLSVVVLTVYYIFVLVAALKPELLAQPVAAGMTFSVGLTAGIVITLFCFVMTGIYVRRANSRYDAMTRDLLAEIGR